MHGVGGLGLGRLRGRPPSSSSGREHASAIRADGVPLLEQIVDLSLHRDASNQFVRFFEDATSGTNDLADRAALADALDALQAHEAHGLVVARLDRLARDLMVQEALLRDVWPA